MASKVEMRLMQASYVEHRDKSIKHLQMFDFDPMWYIRFVDTVLWRSTLSAAEVPGASLSY